MATPHPLTHPVPPAEGCQLCSATTPQRAWLKCGNCGLGIMWCSPRCKAQDLPHHNLACNDDPLLISFSNRPVLRHNIQSVFWKDMPRQWVYLYLLDAFKLWMRDADDHGLGMYQRVSIEINEIIGRYIYHAKELLPYFDYFLNKAVRGNFLPSWWNHPQDTIAIKRFVSNSDWSLMQIITPQDIEFYWENDPKQIRQLGNLIYGATPLVRIPYREGDDGSPTTREDQLCVLTKNVAGTERQIPLTMWKQMQKEKGESTDGLVGDGTLTSEELALAADGSTPLPAKENSANSYGTEQGIQSSDGDNRSNDKSKGKKPAIPSVDVKDSASPASSVIPKAHACYTCQKEKGSLSKCKACYIVLYCSVACQKEDWPSHKKSCIQGPTFLSFRPRDVPEGRVQEVLWKGMPRQWVYEYLIDSFRLRMDDAGVSNKVDLKMDLSACKYDLEELFPYFHYFLTQAYKRKILPAWWNEKDTIALERFATNSSWMINDAVLSNYLGAVWEHDLTQLRLLAFEVYNGSSYHDVKYKEDEERNDGHGDGEGNDARPEAEGESNAGSSNPGSAIKNKNKKKKKKKGTATDGESKVASSAEVNKVRESLEGTKLGEPVAGPSKAD